MIKILLEGNEASEYVNAKAELDKIKAANLKLMAEATRIKLTQPAAVKLPELTDLMSALSTRNYIASVKAVRLLTGSTLIDSKNYLESFFDKADKAPIKLSDTEESEKSDEYSDSYDKATDDESPPTKREECNHEDYYLPEDNVYICLACDKEFEPVKDTEILDK